MTNSMSTSMSSSDNTTEAEDNSTDTTDSTEASSESTMGTAEVRFLNIRLLDSTEALATWAPPNGTSSLTYSAEISYDGKTWKRLQLEEPTSTFAQFMITEQTPFEVRVTPEGGAPSMADWSPKQQKKMAANGKGSDMSGNNGKDMSGNNGKGANMSGNNANNGKGKQ